MSKEIVSDNTKNMERREENSLDRFKNMYYEAKQRFYCRKHMLHPLQIELETLLLDYEKEVYFKKPKLFVQKQRVYVESKPANQIDILEENNDFARKMIKETAKVYKCFENGCEKIYTSLHGLKYHSEKGHLPSDQEKKPYICAKTGCKKRYKNSNGLKYHLEHFHKCK